MSESLDPEEQARLDKLAASGQQRKAEESGFPEDLEQAERMQSSADREVRDLESE